MIYFDNAATTKIDQSILDSFIALNNKYFANPSSNHKLGHEVNHIEEMARTQIANILNVLPEEVIFTSGATESNNLAIKGTAFKYQNRGKHLITTKVEHPSVLNAFKFLEDFGFTVTYLNVNEECKISIEELKASLREDTILVSIMSVNNEVGSINNIDEIGKLLKNYPKIIFHSDATQSIGKIDFDYKDVDLLSMSAHKLHGFKGSGVLIKKKKVDLMPINSGGGQEFGYRSGTNNFPYEVSISKAIRLGFEKMKENYLYVKNLNEYARSLLSEIKEVNINSPIDASPYILNFYTNKKASVVAEFLSIKDIYVSTKSACSSKKESYSYVIYEMGKGNFASSNSIRLSFDRSNTMEEVKEFVNALKEALISIK